MLTDDDLTRQLRATFEEHTHGVTYDGEVPRVRTRPAWAAPGWVALPAAGAVAAAVLVLGSTGTPTPATPGATTPPASRTPSAASTTTATVTDTFTLAGMTFTYERGADEVPLDDQFLRLYEPGRLPAWAESVALESGASAKVWVGQDPATGDVSLFVESPVRWGGKLVGLASPTITVEQMSSLARTGRLS